MKNVAKIIETQYELNYVIPIIGEMLDKFFTDYLIYIFLKRRKFWKQTIWHGRQHARIKPFLIWSKIMKIRNFQMTKNLCTSFDK